MLHPSLSLPLLLCCPMLHCDRRYYPMLHCSILRCPILLLHDLLPQPCFGDLFFSAPYFTASCFAAACFATPCFNAPSSSTSWFAVQLFTSLCFAAGSMLLHVSCFPFFFFFSPIQFEMADTVLGLLLNPSFFGVRMLLRCSARYLILLGYCLTDMPSWLMQ